MMLLLRTFFFLSFASSRISTHISIAISGGPRSQSNVRTEENSTEISRRGDCFARPFTAFHLQPDSCIQTSLRHGSAVTSYPAGKLEDAARKYAAILGLRARKLVGFGKRERDARKLLAKQLHFLARDSEPIRKPTNSRKFFDSRIICETTIETTTT